MNLATKFWTFSAKIDICMKIITSWKSSTFHIFLPETSYVLLVMLIWLKVFSISNRSEGKVSSWTIVGGNNWQCTRGRDMATRILSPKKSQFDIVWNTKIIIFIIFNNSYISSFTRRNISSLITISSQCILTLESTREGRFEIVWNQKIDDFKKFHQDGLPLVFRVNGSNPTSGRSFRTSTIHSNHQS